MIKIQSSIQLSVNYHIFKKSTILNKPILLPMWWGPQLCGIGGGPGQLPHLPHSKSGPAHHHTPICNIRTTFNAHHQNPNCNNYNLIITQPLKTLQRYPIRKNLRLYLAGFPALYVRPHGCRYNWNL